MDTTLLAWANCPRIGIHLTIFFEHEISGRHTSYALSHQDTFIKVINGPNKITTLPARLSTEYFSPRGDKYEADKWCNERLYIFKNQVV